MFCISNLIWNEEEGKRLVRFVLKKIVGRKSRSGKAAAVPEILGVEAPLTRPQVPSSVALGSCGRSLSQLTVNTEPPPWSLHCRSKWQSLPLRELRRRTVRRTWRR